MTDIYREFDPQTRKLKAVTPSVVGGVAGDAKALTLHFRYKNFDPTKQKCYITFDVVAQNGVAYTFTETTAPEFDGKTFVVPYEVMSRVKKNTLGQQLSFLQKDSDDPSFTQSMKDNLTVAETIDLKVILDPLPEWWIHQFRENALVTPVEYDEENTVLTFKTASGLVFPINLKIPSKEDIYETFGSDLDNLKLEIIDAYKEGDRETLRRAKEYVDSKNLVSKDYTDRIAEELRKQLVGVYTVRGSVTNKGLPSTPMKGDVYNILDDGKFPAGSNVVWTGIMWDKLSETVDLDGVWKKFQEIGLTIEQNKGQTKSEIDRLTEMLKVLGNTVNDNSEELSKIGDLEENIAKNTESISSLTTKTQTLTNTVSSMDNKLAGVEGSVTNLRSALDEHAADNGKDFAKIRSSIVNINSNYATLNEKLDTKQPRMVEGVDQLNQNNIVKMIESKVGEAQKEQYVHNQNFLSTEWIIKHNLGRYPLIQQFDNSDPPGPLAGEVKYISENEITISFNAPCTGKAILR